MRKVKYHLALAFGFGLTSFITVAFVNQPMLVLDIWFCILSAAFGLACLGQCVNAAGAYEAVLDKRERS